MIYSIQYQPVSPKMNNDIIAPNNVLCLVALLRFNSTGNPNKSISLNELRILKYI